MADIAITAANFIPSSGATLVKGIYGEAITRGLPLYISDTTTSPKTYKKFDASNSSKNQFAGLACDDASTGQDGLVCTADPALALGGTVAAGDTVWASATGLTKTIADLTAGWLIWVIGVANAANVINFSPTKGAIK